MENTKIRGARLLLIILCFASFLLYAMYFNGFGTNAPATMAFFDIDEGQNGAILTLQAVGCILLSVILGLFGERMNKIHGIIIGLVVMGAAGIAIGLLPLAAPEGGAYPLMLIFSFVAGVGYITIDLLMNGLVADVFPRQKNTLLPYVHAFYGTGAMLAPLFVTALVKPELPSTFARPYLIIGIAAIAVCVLIAVSSKSLVPSTPYADMEAIRSRAKGNPAEIFKDRRAWLYLLTAFFYVSFQTGLSTWLPTYCIEKLDFGFENAGYMVTLYFLGALAVRFLSPLIYKKISVRSFYIATLLLSGGLFLAFLLLEPSPTAARVMIVIMGLLQGASLPGLVILCCEAFPERTASASSLIVFATSIATLVIPALMGRLFKGGSYTLPMLIITAGLFVSVLLLISIKRVKKAV